MVTGAVGRIVGRRALPKVEAAVVQSITVDVVHNDIWFSVSDESMQSNYLVFAIANTVWMDDGDGVAVKEKPAALPEELHVAMVQQHVLAFEDYSLKGALAQDWLTTWG